MVYYIYILPLAKVYKTCHKKNYESLGICNNWESLIPNIFCKIYTYGSRRATCIGTPFHPYSIDCGCSISVALYHCNGSIVFRSIQIIKSLKVLSMNRLPFISFESLLKVFWGWHNRFPTSNHETSLIAALSSIILHIMCIVWFCRRVYTSCFKQSSKQVDDDTKL